jgi:type II secretory pathway pseudopilin PulG
MVELIFVIVIIGILAATAIPKFAGVKDRAKVNAELSMLSSLDGSIIAAKEFRADDYNDDNISWHDSGLANEAKKADEQASEYATINSDRKVLKSIAKKTEGLRIVGLVTADFGDVQDGSSNSQPYKNTILFLTGPASNPNTGVASDEIEGKPDSNDVWVFNPNNWDINITSSDSSVVLYKDPTIIPARSIALVDVNGSSNTYDNTDKLEATRSDGSTSVAATKVAN